MCGIVSMILKDQKKVLGKEYTDMFKQMLYADAVRGWDSTGICCVKGNNDTTVVKDALEPRDLFRMVPDHKWIYQNRAYIGHNRWATRGKLTAENAHPFHEGNITLVHNGTLRFHMFLKNVEVDSHAITHAIAEKGAIDTLEVLDGAYALVWYDQATGNIHATRNEERPLFLLETEDLYLLSSERGLAYWICERFKVKVRKSAALTPGTLYTFRKNKKDVTIIETQKYTPLPPAPDEMSEYFMYGKILPHHDPDPILKPGMHLKVMPFKYTDLGYAAFGLGKHKWLCENPNNLDIAIELYTDDGTDFHEQLINVIVEKVYGAGLNTTIVCRLAPKKKEVSEHSGPIKAINGLELTPEVIEKAKDCLCSFCSAPFVVDKDIALLPVHSNGHLYKYTYYCPDCSEIAADRRQLRAVH